MVAAACLLIAAYQGLAALLVLLVRNLALGLSLTAIMVSPAFGYAGVGFPIAGMQAFARGWGSILPLRWYMQILFDQAARGAPVANSARPFVILAALALLFGGLAWWRLAALARRKAGGPARRGIRAAAPSLGAYHGIGRHRHRRDSPRPGRPRRHGADGDRPTALWRLLPATLSRPDPSPSPDCRGRSRPDGAQPPARHGPRCGCGRFEVAVRANTIAQAQQELFQRHVFGILEIPPGTSREFLKGNAARLPAFVNSAYFLVFSRTLQGIVESAGTVTAELVSHGARSGGEADRLLAVDQPGLGPCRAAVQPDGRLCQLCRAGGLRADPAADAADRRGDAGRGGLRERRQNGAAGTRLRHRRPRPGSRPSDHLYSGPAALSRDLAADLRLLDAGKTARSVPLRGHLHPGHQLLRPGRRHLVQATAKPPWFSSSRPPCRSSSWSACPGRWRRSRPSCA